MKLTTSQKQDLARLKNIIKLQIDNVHYKNNLIKQFNENGLESILNKVFTKDEFLDHISTSLSSLKFRDFAHLKQSIPMLATKIAMIPVLKIFEPISKFQKNLEYQKLEIYNKNLGKQYVISDNGKINNSSASSELISQFQKIIDSDATKTDIVQLNELNTENATEWVLKHMTLVSFNEDGHAEIRLEY